MISESLKPLNNAIIMPVRGIEPQPLVSQTSALPLSYTSQYIYQNILALYMQYYMHKKYDHRRNRTPVSGFGDRGSTTELCDQLFI